MARSITKNLDGISGFVRAARPMSVIEHWRHDYNTNRPHTAHGELTPNEFALHWNTTHPPQAA